MGELEPACKSVRQEGFSSVQTAFLRELWANITGFLKHFMRLGDHLVEGSGRGLKDRSCDRARYSWMFLSILILCVQNDCPYQLKNRSQWCLDISLMIVKTCPWSTNVFDLC